MVDKTRAWWSGGTWFKYSPMLPICYRGKICIHNAINYNRSFCRINCYCRSILILFEGGFVMRSDLCNRTIFFLTIWSTIIFLWTCGFVGVIKRNILMYHTNTIARSIRSYKPLFAKTVFWPWFSNVVFYRDRFPVVVEVVHLFPQWFLKRDHSLH